MLGLGAAVLREAALSVLPEVDVLRLRQFRSCAVVGASGHLLHDSLGTEIDSHDAVLRFNYHPASPGQSVGRRTTVRIVNPGETIRLLEEWEHHQMISQSDDKISSSLHPELAFLTFTNEPSDINKFVMAKHHFPDANFFLIGPGVIEKTRLLLQHAADAAGLPQHSSNFLPSTGLSGLVLAPSMCSRVTAYGFYSTYSDKSNYENFSQPTPLGLNLTRPPFSWDKVQDLQVDYNELVTGEYGDITKHNYELESIAQKMLGAELGIQFK